MKVVIMGLLAEMMYLPRIATIRFAMADRKSKEQYPAIGARRFGRAVDAALHSLPLHPEPKGNAAKDDAPRRRIKVQTKNA
jgi:hypothetical protein